jgi:hypothetical protein
MELFKCITSVLDVWKWFGVCEMVSCVSGDLDVLIEVSFGATYQIISDRTG